MKKKLENLRQYTKIESKVSEEGVKISETPLFKKGEMITITYMPDETELQEIAARIEEERKGK